MSAIENAPNSQNGYESWGEHKVSPDTEPAVANLIDFGSSGEEDSKTPTVSARISPNGIRDGFSHMNGVTYEGVAPGFISPTASLIDSPLDHQTFTSRPSTSSSSPTSGTLMPPSSSSSGSSTHKKSSSLSSMAHATQLFAQARQNNGSGGSRRSSFNSDIENMSVSESELHSELSDISSQVHKIQKHLSSLEENHFNSDEKVVRLKQDNAVLQERYNGLEEHLQQIEDRWKDKYEEEKRRNKDLMGRIEREKCLETESLTLKLQLLQNDLAHSTNEREKFSGELAKTQLENGELREECDDLKFRLQETEKELEEQTRDNRKFQRDAQDELKTQSEIIDDLRSQIEAGGARPRQSSVVDKNEMLEDELKRLRGEERRLNEEKEELQAQLLQASFEHGRSLLAEAGTSLAEELHGKDKDELINALKEQEIANHCLRKYIEGILTRVIENHPEILQIK